MKNKVINNILYPVVSIAVALALWSVVAWLYDEPLIFPNISSVMSQLWALLGNSSTYSSIASTTLRTIVCYILSCIIACVLAMCASLCNAVHRLLAPIVTIISAVPIVAITLIVVILVPSQYSPILISLLVVMPILYNAILVAMGNMQLQLDMAKVYNVPTGSVIRYIHLPTMLPLLVEHSKTTLVLALKVVVSAEVLAYTVSSIGSGMYSARINIATAQLLAWTILCLVLCFVIQGIVTLCQYLYRRYRQCQ